MNDEAAKSPSQFEDGKSPVTKSDLLGLWQRIESRFDQFDERLRTVESRTTATQRSVDNLAEQMAIFRGEVQAAVEENRNHFDVAVEHIRAELEGANRDEVSALQDGIKNLRVRVAALEERR